MIEYLTVLIDSENIKKKEGYDSRVKQLITMKEMEIKKA